MLGLRRGNYEFDMQVVYDADDIYEGVKSLSQKMRESLDFSNVLYVCMLDSGVQFFADITKRLPSGTCHYLNVIQDLAGRCSVQAEPLISSNLSHILIFDVMCETGNRLEAAVKLYHRHYPITSISTVLLIRQERSDAIYKPNWVVFDSAPSCKYAGYGLDNNGQDRTLPYIYVVDDRR